ncbi:MAG: hypothetical protein IEMM0008_0975 [bacterium]|nr:MAG: hypothetical protein IEMM0008_0975 [bacterium]
MPEILRKHGWKVFFYSNERNEPIHVHCVKAEKICKYWLDIENYDIQEASSYKMNPKDRREVRKIIFENFDYIMSEWNKVHG